MKTKSTLILAAAGLFAIGLNAAPNSIRKNPVHTPIEQLQPDEYMGNTIIVNVLPEYRSLCSVNQIAIPALNDFFLMIGADRVEKMFPNHKAPEKPYNAQGAPMEDISLIYTVHYNGAMPLSMAIGKMFNLGYFEYAQPYYIPKVDFTPNDPQATSASSYHIYKIAAASTSGTSGWDISTGSASVVIGITDTGVELTHSDLTNQIAYNTADPINGTDDDNDGFIDNYRGWDVGMNDNDPTWQGNAHGVHVSGCASAQVNNNTGVAGSGFNCKFLPVKIADASGALTGSYQGITYAADHGCKVINCSWGGTGGGPFGQSIIDYATNNMDALVIAAAGNNATDQAFYPAAFDKVLSVASTASNDLRSSFTNWNYTVDVCSPGTNINATWTSNSYTQSSGTSMASPVCAGVAAIVRSYFPTYTALQAGERVKFTTDYIYNIGSNSSATYADKLGTGRINLYKALTDPAVPSVLYQNMSIVDNNDNVLVANDTMRITGDFMNYLAPTTNMNAVLTVASGGTFVTILDGTTTPGVIATLASVGHNPDPFQVRINANAPANQPVVFRLTMTDGTWTYDQYFTVIVNVDYINVAINQVSTSITSKGLIGYNADAQQQGLGFTYNGSGSLLYESSFMVGVSGNVRDMARGTATTPDADFVSMNVVQENTPAVVSDMDLEGKFRDNGSANALPVTVHHTAYAWSAAPHDKYVIVQYVIVNTGSSTLNNVHSGIFCDWDIDATTYNDNKADYDSNLKLGYTYHTLPGYYCGVKVLTNTAAATCYSIDNVNGGNGGVDMYNGYDDADKFTTLSTNRAQAGNTTATGNDVCQVVASGPFTIAAGDSVVVAFALIAGDDLADLQNSAADAQIQYDNQVPLGNVTVDGNGNSNVNVYPSPVAGNATITYNVAEQSQTDVRMYDAAGREVMIIAQGNKAAGTYTETLNVAILPNGIYVIRMVAGEAVSTRRFVISH